MLYEESNKNDTKELTYKTETNSQISKPVLWLPKVKLLREVEMGGENNIYTLLYKIDD